MESYNILINILLILIFIRDCRADKTNDRLPFESADHTSGFIDDIIPSCIFGAHEISLYLYDRSDPRNYTVVDAYSNDIPLMKNLSIVFLIHGFNANPNIASYVHLAESWGRLKTYNVFAVNWKQGACDDGNSITRFLSYPLAMRNAQKVAVYTAEFIGRLIQHFGFLLESMTLVGHSLGAHVAGSVGEQLQIMNIGRIPIILGLDPAIFGSEYSDDVSRISKLDGHYVQIIHTSNVPGIFEPVGMDDFYFNGGANQPGCAAYDMDCNHERAIWYLIDILNNLDCPFTGKIWNRSHLPPLKATCTRQNCSVAGPLAVLYDLRGTFYVQTNRKSPYCLKEEQN